MNGLFVQNCCFLCFLIIMKVTTHSKLLSEEDKEDIENNIPELREKIAMFSLQAFGTEQQFSRQIRHVSIHININSPFKVV